MLGCVFSIVDVFADLIDQSLIRSKSNIGRFERQIDERGRHKQQTQAGEEQDATSS